MFRSIKLSERLTSKHRIVNFIITACTVFCMQAWADEKQAKIVLIIDDMGHSLALGKQAINLPGAINYAFLPYAPHRVSLANLAHQREKEVMLHAPMANLANKPTGPNAITPIMSHQDILHSLAESLAAVPHVKGVNNHMGSLMTQLRQPMDWFMAALKKKELYFVDSRTTPLSVADSIAEKHRIPNLKRDVFLDNKLDHASLNAQFEQLIAMAKTNGVAVGIGHPHPETLTFLEGALSNIETRGVSLVLASTNIAEENCLRQPHSCPGKVEMAELENNNSAKN